MAAGKPSKLPVVVVENASLPEQRVRYTTLAALPRLAYLMPTRLHQFAAPG